jgi:hypothetical protein
MRRLAVLFIVGFALTTLGLAALACGPGDDKPPLTPDPVEHTLDEAGAPPAAPAPQK